MLKWIGDEVLQLSIPILIIERNLEMQLCLDWVSKSLLKIKPDNVRRSFECCKLKDGDCQSCDHLSLSAKKMVVNKIDLDDSDAEIALINEFKAAKNLYSETNLNNAEQIIINSCSNETFLIPFWILF